MNHVARSIGDKAPCIQDSNAASLLKRKETNCNNPGELQFLLWPHESTHLRAIAGGAPLTTALG